MKYLIPLLLLGLPAHAAVRSTAVDTVQLTVNSPSVQTSRVGANYNSSGYNISSTTMGGISVVTSRRYPAPPPTLVIRNGIYSVTSDGQSFGLSESSTASDTTVTQQSLSSSGMFESPNLYGNSTTNIGGVAGTLSGTLSPTGLSTVTSGGAGTTATGQRTIQLSVFK